MSTSTDALVERIRDGIIGADAVVHGPFGPRPLVYADYTASGRAVGFIEDVIRDAVLPHYANTHTESSATGRQTTRLREEARAIVHRALGADDDVVVLFCESGCTGAVNKLVHILGLRIPAALDERWGLSAHIPAAARPLVVVGPYEHHSNELPWRESIAEVVEVAEDPDGCVDLADLERILVAHRDRELVIGSFSAASNVTGILTDTDAVSALLHRHGALAFWDCAAAGPYTDLRMSGGPPGTHKDAVFLSPHKLVGGPGTPGVLAVRRALLANAVPSVPGGGTVRYVSGRTHRYVDDPVEREEGGTPAIVDCIRAGLTFHLKEAVGVAEIHRRETANLHAALAVWDANPDLEILGSRTAERLPIVSFRVRCGSGHLHHNLVVALLNDLFGIQTRGGCSCAGPYGHRLLGIDGARSLDFERQTAAGHDGLKPGWTRLNLSYFIGTDVLAYLIEAVDLVARHGWRLLPDYAFDLATGLWTHRDVTDPPWLSLRALHYDDDGVLQGVPAPQRSPGPSRASALAAARRLLGADGATAAPRLDGRLEDPEAEALRWFPLAGATGGPPRRPGVDAAPAAARPAPTGASPS